LEDLAKGFSSLTGGNSGGGGGSSSKYYTVGITGSTGLIGTEFQNELRRTNNVNGKPVRIITFQRGTVAESIDSESLDDAVFTSAVTKSVTWNPNGDLYSFSDDADSNISVIDATVIQKLDALVHLSGENISTGEGVLAPLGIRPWTETKKQEILDSRTKTTSALAAALKASGNKKCDFLVASGIGVYGDNAAATQPADEATDISTTTGFLAEVSRQWEAASAPAAQAGNRVCQLRNGVVLATEGGALAKLYPIFFVGGGGIVGDGTQYFPFVSNRDMARAMVHVLNTPQLQGPININAPTTATNAEFTQAMGTVMGRPTLIPFPAFAVSLLFGEMGEEVLLGGTQATPKKLLESGFTFQDPSVEDAVRTAIVNE